MLKLISFPPALDEPSASPFCVKAMCLLQASGQAWQPKFTNDPRKAPNRKLPLLIDGADSIPDSDGIRAYFENRYGVDFDEGLTAEQRATSRAIIRMVEEHTYFVAIANRWLNDANWNVLKDIFFGKMKMPLRAFVPNMVRKSTRAQITAQGTARHSVTVQTQRAEQDIAALKTLLGDKPFLFGDAPTAADMSVVPIFRAILTAPTQTDLRDLVMNDPTLVDYLDRGKDAMYPA